MKKKLECPFPFRRDNQVTKKPQAPQADEASQIIYLNILYHRYKQTLLGLLHLGQTVFGESLDGLVPFLVAESGLGF